MAPDSDHRGVIMKSKAAILWETHTPWSVEEIELDPPGPGEVLVKLAASGLCHSDEHLVTGDLPFPPPIIGGHEGAGVVQEVGVGVSWLEPGDHVVFGFIPACGRCVSCSTGHSNLCDLGAKLGGPGQIADGTFRHHAQTALCASTSAAAAASSASGPMSLAGVLTRSRASAIAAAIRSSLAASTPAGASNCGWAVALAL